MILVVIIAKSANNRDSVEAETFQLLLGPDESDLVVNFEFACFHVGWSFLVGG